MLIPFKILTEYVHFVQNTNEKVIPLIFWMKKVIGWLLTFKDKELTFDIVLKTISYVWNIACLKFE